MNLWEDMLKQWRIHYINGILNMALELSRQKRGSFRLKF